MADQTDEKQTIKEFIDNLLDDLGAGRITPEAAVVAAGQYEGLRRVLSQNVESLALSSGRDGQLSVGSVTQALRAASAGIEAAPPQFKAEKPDAALSPKEVLDRAGALRSSEKIVAGAITRQQKNVAGLRKTFIERLVANWIARSRLEMDGGTVDEGAITRKLEGFSDEDLSGPGATRAIEAALAVTPAAPRAVRDAVTEASGAKQEMAKGVRALSGAHEIPKALYPRAGAPGLERFAVIATSIIAGSGLPTEAAIERADTLSRVAEATMDPRADHEEGGAIPTKFFTVIAQGRAQKFVAGAADALFSQLSPLARQDVIRTTFSRALEQALAKTDGLTTRLGEDFVNSELFRLVMDNTKKEFARAPSGRSGSGQAKGALDDIFSAILVGPATAPLLGGPHEAILAYFELLAINARLPKGAPAVLPGKVEAVALLLAAASTGGAAPAGGAVASVLTAGAASFAKQLPSWERFYLMMVALVSPETALSQATSSGISLPHVGAPEGGGLGGAIGGALSWAGLGLAGVAGRAGGGLVGLLFGGALASPFGRRTEKTSFWDDTPLMIAVFIGAAIILLFVLPTFLNGGAMSKFAKNAAFLVESSRWGLSGRGIGIEGKDKITYNGPQPQPASAVSGCPIEHGVFASITQCPNDNRPNYSHYFTKGWSNAYDIGLFTGTNVYATHDGNLVEYVSDVPQNAGADYGNYVMLAGTDPSSGKLYFTIYGHLLNVSDAIKSLCGGAARCSGVSSALRVSGRTLLGTSDHTGASSGPHLHYELRNADGSKPPFELPVGCGGFSPAINCSAL